MPQKIISVDNFVFFIAALSSVIVCYTLLGISTLTLAVSSVMFTFIIYSAKENNGDYLYTFIWIVIILLGCYLGIKLKLSAGFYLFLFIVSNYYYISYNKDPFSDRAIPFVIIFASLGTTIKGLNEQSAIAFFIGTLLSLLILRITYKNKVEFTAFKSGLFSKSLYSNSNNVIFSSLVYSFFLFICLFLPDRLGLDRIYWAPMTFVVLLKPKDIDTIKNTIYRFLGSAAGALFVIAILYSGIHSKTLNVIIVSLCVFLLPTFLKLSNLLRTFALTSLVLLMIEYSTYWNDPNYTLPDARIYETFIGGSIAILASIVLKFLKKHSKHFI